MDRVLGKSRSNPRTRPVERIAGAIGGRAFPLSPVLRGEGWGEGLFVNGTTKTRRHEDSHEEKLIAVFPSWLPSCLRVFVVALA